MNPTLKYKVIRGRLINSTITQRQLLHPEHKLLGSHNNMIWADTFSENHWILIQILILESGSLL